MPYYGTMEMSLHCCGRGCEWWGGVRGEPRGRHARVTTTSKGGRRPWFTARTCGCLCLNENYTWNSRYRGTGARPFPHKVTNLWTRDTSAEVPALRSWKFKRSRYSRASTEFLTPRYSFWLLTESMMPKINEAYNPFSVNRQLLQRVTRYCAKDTN